ncbi:hypothetical protein [Absidia glauca]|uniref:Uncharacterized protein n=1 Tax=Absidia glauca TaxID=4829 RepID=A0A168QCA6_ABSGL|nr:hypothetical protein [Absidia glauca]
MLSSSSNPFVRERSVSSTPTQSTLLTDWTSNSGTAINDTNLTQCSNKRGLDITNDSTQGTNKHAYRSPHRSTWTTYETIQQRSLYGQRMFGRRIHVSGRPLLQRYQCHEDQVYYYFFPDGKSCVPFVCDYAHAANNGNLLAVSDEEGRVSILRTDKSNQISEREYHRSFYTHRNAVVDIKWSKDDSSVLSSGGDGKLRIMDVESDECLGTFIGHRSIMKSANWHPTNPHLLVSSGSDGSFNIWDTRFRQLGTNNDAKYVEEESMEGIDIGCYPIYGPIKSVPDAHVEPKSRVKRQRASAVIHAGRTVTCALFYPNDEEKVITSGSFDGTIKLWDCRVGRTPSPLQVTSFQQNGRRKGIADMKIDQSGTRLFSLCTDSSVYMHYMLDLSLPAKRYTDPTYEASLFTIKLSISYDDQFLLAGSTNNSIYVWDIDGDQTQAHTYKGHSDIVSSVAWHKSRNDQFASCSDDFHARIWKA